MAGSTDLITYLNFIAGWENESDENIGVLIEEHDLFVGLDNFDSEQAIEKEFKTLTDLAITVRDETITADSLQIASDAAAIASIWSFGMGMATFMVLQTEAILLKGTIAKDSKKLNEKLKTIDTDIAAQINENIEKYIDAYKNNNELIAAKGSVIAPGLDIQNCRADLMQFMAQTERVYRDKGGLTIENFKQLAGSARLVFNSDEIKKVYDALDILNFSDKSQINVDKFMAVFNKLSFNKPTLEFIRFGSMILVQRMGVAKESIQTAAERAGLPLEEYGASAFKTCDSVAKFGAGIVILISVIDTYYSILDIIDVVKKTKIMVDALNGDIKQSYIEYFDSIKEASKAYNEAVKVEGL